MKNSIQISKMHCINATKHLFNTQLIELYLNFKA